MLYNALQSRPAEVCSWNRAKREIECSSSWTSESEPLFSSSKHYITEWKVLIRVLLKNSSQDVKSKFWKKRVKWTNPMAIITEMFRNRVKLNVVIVGEVFTSEEAQTFRSTRRLSWGASLSQSFLNVFWWSRLHFLNRFFLQASKL